MSDPVIEKCRHNSNVDLQCVIDVTSIGPYVNLQTDIRTTHDVEEGVFLLLYKND
jgi:hypothetical protein